jgi:hypothetical protein
MTLKLKGACAAMQFIVAKIAISNFNIFFAIKFDFSAGILKTSDPRDDWHWNELSF